MIRFTLIVLTLLVSSTATGQPYVTSITTSPVDPIAGDEVSLLVHGDMPDGCWSFVGTNGNTLYLDDIGGEGVGCVTLIVPFDTVFDLGILDAGMYTVTIWEFHDSTRNPGMWQHVHEFAVEQGGVMQDLSSWGNIKATFR